MSFLSTDTDVRLVGEGGNSRIYILDREYNGMPSAAIKVPKAFVCDNVTRTLENYCKLKDVGIKTTAFVEECVFDGQRALITENLHQKDYTYLDANAHLQLKGDKLLRMIDADFGVRSNEKEPEEERYFADNKFEKITNLDSFVKDQLEFLKSVSEHHIYMAYDCYFFKVKREKVTDIDYIIADWDDIQDYDEDNLYKENKEAFNTAIRQFVARFVEEGDIDKNQYQ